METYGPVPVFLDLHTICFFIVVQQVFVSVFSVHCMHHNTRLNAYRYGTTLNKDNELLLWMNLKTANKVKLIQFWMSWLFFFQHILYRMGVLLIVAWFRSKSIWICFEVSHFGFFFEGSQFYSNYVWYNPKNIEAIAELWALQTVDENGLFIKQEF